MRRLAWPELSGARCVEVDDGMSDATVYRVSLTGAPVRYLKVAHGAAADRLHDEGLRTRWLAEQGMPVPDILRADARDDFAALLMAAVPGAAAARSRLPPRVLAQHLARALAALHALHALPVGGCPFDETFAARLARADEAVAAGAVDPDEFAERNIGRAPEDILAQLRRHQPREELVVVHGDATLDNLFIDAAGAVSFIDCGTAGRGDRHIDLAVTADALSDVFGDDSAAAFIAAYREAGGAPWDEARARYCLDLYELY